MSELRRLFSGTKYNIYAEMNAGRCPIETEFTDYEKKNPKGMMKVAALLNDIANNGFMDIDERECRLLSPGLYEVKERNGLFRVFAMLDPRRHRIVILISTWSKRGSGKEQNAQIERARKMQRQYQRHPLPFEQ